MDLIGKIVRHSSYGQGIVTAFYPANNTIWLAFENQPERPYDILDDFDSGLLKSDEREIVEAIARMKSLPSYRLATKTLGQQKTKDKDLNRFLSDSLALLKELGIQPGNIESICLEERGNRWGVCSKLSNGQCRIGINKLLARDEIPDWMVYQVIIHELLHSVRECCGHGHNKTWKALAEKVNSKCGYDIAVGNKLFDYLLLEAAGVWPHFNMQRS